ncbi:dialkylrecorsinol condensing enzyme DarA [Gelidibacter japonicus]|mgnify:CR=1 FL=1|uniref:dialkylrecorsinol condensing enzyme DarA n=1 Tax=Gelidibacter japonicus TaxID=1962232 RepID=UPI003A9393E1|tara:strand:- start:10884 stop:11804 length:921 start_codon:yes stop_codon:yes gene_type:complete
MKEVLVVYYSQTGQLFNILEKIVSTLSHQDVNITYYEIVPDNEYEFPWKTDNFYDVFPESFLQIPQAFKSPNEEILGKKYDLVLLGYTVWYLTPSIPVNSFMKSEWAKKLLKDTPVVTVIACRNMWLMAQEKMKKLLHDCDAKLVGNIALVDKNINHVSVITIMHWMFNGKKTKFLGVFPKPGVSEKDIQAASLFGKPIQNALLSNNFNNLQKQLLELKAVKVKPLLIATDKRGNVVFSKWANAIIKKGGPGDPKRKKWLGFFKYYLLFAIWVIAPIVFVVFLLTYIPMKSNIDRNKKYFASVDSK